MKKIYINSTRKTLAVQALKQSSLPNAPLLPCCHTQIIRVTNTPIAIDDITTMDQSRQAQFVLHPP